MRVFYMNPTKRVLDDLHQACTVAQIVEMLIVCFFFSCYSTSDDVTAQAMKQAQRCLHVPYVTAVLAARRWQGSIDA